MWSRAGSTGGGTVPHKALLCDQKNGDLPILKKEYPMRLEEWEATIQEIVDECKHEKKGADTILTAWRAKLEKEPILLKPFEIGKIMREVRRRLNNVGR